MTAATSTRHINRARGGERPDLGPIRESDLIFRALMQCLDFYRAFLAKRLPAIIPAFHPVIPAKAGIHAR
ncbi:MAG: hypothetical protein AAF471_07860 [Myxococcota bacterium]